MSSGTLPSRCVSHLRGIGLGVILAIFLSAAWSELGAQPNAATTAASAAAIPADHEQDRRAGLVATDLEHGSGMLQLAVRRTWGGTETLNTHFGPGWVDANLVQLRLIDPDTLLIWRGGTGWRLAFRRDNAFALTDGGQIQSTASGWSARLPGGLTLRFDAGGQLISEQPAAGPVRNYKYDERGRLLSVGTSADNLLRYHYDQSGKRVVLIDGPEGLRLEYRYDDRGRLAEVLNARQVRINYRYGTDGELEQASDQFGSVLNVPQAFRHAAGATEAPIPPEPEMLLHLPQIAVEFDDKGRVKQQTMAGRTNRYEYDRLGRISSVTTPQGRTGITHDAFGRVTGIAHPDGLSTRIEYNRLDLPTKLITGSQPAEELRYNEQGMLVRRSRSANDWEEYAYDAAGRLGVVRRPSAGEERYAYEGEGDRPASIQYADGRKVSFGYDSAGRLISEAWSSGEHSSRRYDAKDQLVEFMDAAGLKTSYAYDERGRLIASEDPVHGKTSYRHALSGEMTVEHPVLGKSRFATSPGGQVSAMTLPDGGRTVFRYDTRDKLQAVVPPSGLPWRYEHDPAGRLTAIVSPAGVKTVLQRNAAGRLAAITRGTIAWRQYRYDAATGRLQQELSPTGVAAGFHYDAEGRIRQLDLPQGPVTFSREPKGQQASIKGPDYQIDEHYHADGTLARRSYQPAQLELKLPRDAHGRPAGIELNQQKASYVYNARGQVERIDLPGGASIQVSFDTAGRPINLAFANAGSLAIAYDQADRIMALTGKQTNGQALWSERYVYDAAGNLSQLTSDTAASKKLEYDRGNQLTRVSGAGSEQAFRYDVDGNLVSSGKGSVRWRLDALGRPVQQGANRYGWDGAGNLTLIENAITRTEHVFDAAGRLIERNNGQQSWRHGYLPNGDRLWQQGPMGKRWYAYLPDRLAGFKDERGVTWLLVTLPGSDWPLALAGSNGKLYYILADRLGSTRRLIDASGAAVLSADYGPFGNVERFEGAPPIALFAGMLRDEGGLFYARQRHYDPQLARFISIDPLIGLPGSPDSHNAYAYAANNPLRYRDPLGAGILSATEGTGEYMLYSQLNQAERAAAETAWEQAAQASRTIQSAAAAEAEKQAAQKSLAEANSALTRMLERGRLRWQVNIARMAIEEGQLTPEVLRASKETLQRATANLESHMAGGAYRSAFAESVPVAVKTAVEGGAGTVGKGTLNIGRNALGPSVRTTLTNAAGEAAASAATGKAEEQAASSLASRLLQGAKGMARSTGLKLLKWLGIGANALLVADIVEYNYAGAKMIQSEQAALDARQAANKIRQALTDKIRQIARDNPGILMPLDDGRIPDPNNPADIDLIIGKLHSNLNTEWTGATPRRPLEGIFKQGPSPAEEQALQAALASARKQIADARALEGQARSAAAKAARQEDEARAQLKRAVTITGARAVAGADLASLPVAADDVRKQTAALGAQTAGLQSAHDAMTIAGSRCEAAANQACGFAQQAANATEVQLAAWRTTATNEVLYASNQLNAAQARIDAADLALDQLRTSKSMLEGYREKLALFQLGSSMANAAGAQVQSAWSAAQAAAQQAQSERARLAELLTRIQGTSPQVQTLLAPYGSNAQAAMLIGQAEVLGQGIDAPGLFNWDSLVAFASPAIDAFFASQRQVEQAVAAVDIDALAGAANDTLVKADSLRAQASTLATSPDRYRPLQRASQCLVQISTAAASAAAAPPAETVTVPDITGLDDPIARYRKLQEAGLTERPMHFGIVNNVGKHKDFKVSHQDPNPGAPAPRNKIVKIYIFDKYVDPAKVDSAALPAPAAQSPAPPPGPTTPQAAAKPPSSGTPPADQTARPGSTQATASSSAPAAQEDTVTVPSVAGADSIEYMRIVLHQRGLKSSFSARKPTKQQDELKYAGQDPPAGTKVARNSTVTVYIYQRFEPDSQQAQTVAPKDAVPNVVGKAWEEGVSILSNAGFGISGITVQNPPSPDQAGKIATQGAPDEKKRIALTRYGESQAGGAATAAANPPAPGIENMPSGPEREFIGKFKGTMTATGATRGGTRDVTIDIARTGDKWSLYIGVPPNGTMTAGSSATVTLHGGELRYEQRNPYNYTIVTIKVNGNQLAGAIETKDLRSPDNPVNTMKLQAIRAG